MARPKLTNLTVWRFAAWGKVLKESEKSGIAVGFEGDTVWWHRRKLIRF
jgi:hypothetical protein